ncbi:MAG: LytR/AlgR family response regulator transcription factor, partial [Candidatus Cryptobacteroides sp.]
RCMLKNENTDIDNLIRALTTKAREYKDRILVHNEGYILPVSINNVSYFISESKDSFVVVKNGTRYSIDKSLDNLMSDLDPDRFFRISRSIIISKDIVSKITKSPNGQLVLSTICQSGDSGNMANVELIVSRARSKDFMLWIGE